MHTKPSELFVMDNEELIEDFCNNKASMSCENWFDNLHCV